MLHISSKRAFFHLVCVVGYRAPLLDCHEIHDDDDDTVFDAIAVGRHGDMVVV